MNTFFIIPENSRQKALLKRYADYNKNANKFYS